MIKLNNIKWNVDTNTVEQLPVELNVGDFITVCADVPATTAPNPNPISWTLSHIPTPPSTERNVIQTGDDIYSGTFTFKAVAPGGAIIKYEVTAGTNKGKTKTIQLKIV